MLKVQQGVVDGLVAKGRVHLPSHSVFLTGDRGVGKTYLMLRLLERTSVSVAPWMLVVPPGSGSTSSAVSASSRSSASSLQAPFPGQHADVLDIPRTSGVNLQESRIVTASQHYRVMYLDSEGFNAATPPPPPPTVYPPSPLPTPLSPVLSAEDDSDEEATTQEVHNGFRRPGVRQLIPHLAYRTGDVVVYVWDGGCGEEGSVIGSPGGALPNLSGDCGDLQARIRRAYTDCLESLALKTPTPTQTQPHPNAPSLLIILNKTPLRRCYVSGTFHATAATPEPSFSHLPQQNSHTSGGSSSAASRLSPSSTPRGSTRPTGSSKQSTLFDAHYVGEEACTSFVKALDAKRGRPLQSLFTDIRCYTLPLRGSKWRHNLTGSAVFESALTVVSILLNTMLREGARKRLSTRGEGVNLSELSWSMALPRIVAGINQERNWGAPCPLSKEVLKGMNQASFDLHAERKKQAAIDKAEQKRLQQEQILKQREEEEEVESSSSSDESDDTEAGEGEEEEEEEDAQSNRSEPHGIIFSTMLKQQADLVGSAG